LRAVDSLHFLTGEQSRASPGLLPMPNPKPLLEAKCQPDESPDSSPMHPDELRNPEQL